MSLSQKPLVFASKIDEIINRAREKFLDIAQEERTFSEFEGSVHEIVNQIGREVLSARMPGWDIKADAIEHQGHRYNQAGRYSKKYQSLFGQVEITRYIYRNRNSGDSKCICPFELQAGVINGYWTPKAARLGTLVMTELPSQRSENILNEATNMRVSSSSLDLLMKTVGDIWEGNRAQFDSQLINDFEIAQEAASVAVSLDGVLIPTRCTRILPSDSRYEEASCGTISLFDAEGDRISTVQYSRSPEHKKDTLKTQLKQAMDTLLEKRPDLEVIKLADGARDNWRFLESQIPGDRNIIDFFHASEHLKEGLDSYFGESSSDSYKMHKLYRNKLKSLKTGAKQVLAYLTELQSEKPKNKKLSQQVTYFRRNWNKMAYATTQAENLPIGSGIVEAACKTLVTQRLKCSGMHWDYSGAQSILSLRAVNQSGWFDTGFELIREKSTHNVIPLKKVSRGKYESMENLLMKIAC